MSALNIELTQGSGKTRRGGVAASAQRQPVRDHHKQRSRQHQTKHQCRESPERVVDQITEAGKSGIHGASLHRI